ncbi:MAG TPA: F0F1 ATP synthase subunit C [Deltaproteobacteria bacterium]|nr:F0F1 ATP synthase subunit C [Deltaproteobacteria bacterium]
MKKFLTILPVMAAMLLVGGAAWAQDGATYSFDVGNLGSGFAMGLAVLGGGIGQGMAARGMYESVSRNPQAAGALNAPFYVGLAFIESICLFALVVAFGIAG